MNSAVPPAQDDEKKTSRGALARLKSVGPLAYRWIRLGAHKVPGLRSAWSCAFALLDFARDRFRKPSSFEGLYRTPDPWEYEKGDGGRRHLLAASMLERARPDGFLMALEIGCGEGLFTELLARYCRSLVAVDFAPTALEHARKRLREDHVRFEELSLERDPIPGQFDLITAMDVLSYFVRPARLKRAIDKIVAGLRPGGYLLFTDTRQSTMFETEWWGRWLLRGGLNIRTYIGSRPSLTLVSAEITETHVLGLFRKD